MRRYLITGAALGLGRALAIELLRRGDCVCGIDRIQGTFLELDSGMQERLFQLLCDISDADQVASALGEMKRREFLPDVVVLNAAINPERLGMRFTMKMCEQILRINALGALVWVEAFLESFRKRGRGQFVAISSLSSLRGDVRFPTYCASKAVLTLMFEGFRGLYSREGVIFTTVLLGGIDTTMKSSAFPVMRIPLQTAVERILKAIDRQAHTVSVPRAVRLLIELARFVPDPLFALIIGWGARRTAKRQV